MNSQSPLQHQPQAPQEGELLSPVGKQITLSQQEYTQLKWNSNYWEAQHKRACEREAVLKQELKHEKAKVRDLNQRLFVSPLNRRETVTPKRQPGDKYLPLV
jgi:hypothetical protein